MTTVAIILAIGLVVGALYIWLCAVGAVTLADRRLTRIAEERDAAKRDLVRVETERDALRIYKDQIHKALITKMTSPPMVNFSDEQFQKLFAMFFDMASKEAGKIQ